MRALVLAFENLDDLPKDWKKYKTIDAYGFADPNIRIKNVHFYRRFFDIKDYHKVHKPYSLCSIRHPDPWGEPRNWMQGIAALGECLSGELRCEFWYPHEIIAFDFLLKSLLESNAMFIKAQQIGSAYRWKNYQAVWEVNKGTVKKDMEYFYEENKNKILKNFYTRLSKYTMSDVSIDYVKKSISGSFD